MITPEQWERLVLEIGKRANIGQACEAANIARSSFYNRRKSDQVFASEVQEAIDGAMDRLERSAWIRAVDGVEKPTAHGPVREYSDALLMFLMKAHRPAKFSPTIRQELSGPNGQPLGPAVIIMPATDPDQPE